MSRRTLVAGGLTVGGAAVVGAMLLTRRAGEDAIPPQAQALIDRGLDELDQGVLGVERQAPAHLLRATELAPRSATAWGALALGYAVAAAQGEPASQPGAQARTAFAVRRALELDPGTPTPAWRWRWRNRTSGARRPRKGPFAA